ncbi:hypothetical protein VCHA43P282_20004 [Vibrio chagasii]|nr:hypothetical protein VCHA43P282_20004 [Vibrio chagasii]
MFKNLYASQPLSVKIKDKTNRRFQYSSEMHTSGCNIIPFPFSHLKSREVPLAKKVVGVLDSPSLSKVLTSSQLIKTSAEHHGIPIYRLNYAGSVSVEVPSNTELGLSNLSIIKLDEKIYFNLNQLIVASGIHHCFKKLNIHGVRKIIYSCDGFRFDNDIKLIESKEIKSSAFNIEDRNVSYKIIHSIYCKVRTERSPYEVIGSSYSRKLLSEKQKTVIYHRHSCDYVTSEGCKKCNCDAHRCFCSKVKGYFKKLSPPKYAYWFPMDLLEELAVNVIKYAYAREYEEVTNKLLLDGFVKIDDHDIHSERDFEELNVRTQTDLGNNLKYIREAKKILYDLTEYYT